MIPFRLWKGPDLKQHQNQKSCTLQNDTFSGDSVSFLGYGLQMFFLSTQSYGNDPNFPKISRIVIVWSCYCILENGVLTFTLVDIYMSAIGAFIWLVILIIWLSVFLTQRTKWGLLGDKLSIVIPKGF